MGMAAILFNDAEPFEQSVNNPLTEGPRRRCLNISWYRGKGKYRTPTPFLPHG